MGCMECMKLYGTLALGLLAGTVACDRPERVDANAEAIGSEEQALMPPQEMDPEMIGYIMEIQQIQQKLEPIQREALQDETLARQLEAIQHRVETSMREEGTELFGRIDSFQTEMAEAEAADDQERIQSLMIEAHSIQQEVQALQAAVLRRPEISEPLADFEAAHRARMIEIDPEAEPLLERVDELMASLPR